MTKDAARDVFKDGSPAARGGEDDGGAAGQRDHSVAAIDSLKQAMRRARADNAERAGVTSDLRAARLGRLELLREALKPLLAQIPPEVDAFDVGLLPGADPRLFIDMIGFVEMGRDGRLYRLVQDTRNGRIVLKESDEVATMVDAVTDYVARRLLERERALAADMPLLDEPRPAGPGFDAPGAAPALPASSRPGRPGGAAHLLAVAFAFLIDLLGSVTLFTALALGLWYAWTRLHAAS